MPSIRNIDRVDYRAVQMDVLQDVFAVLHLRVVQLGTVLFRSSFALVGYPVLSDSGDYDGGGLPLVMAAYNEEYHDA